MVFYKCSYQQQSHHHCNIHSRSTWVITGSVISAPSKNHPQKDRTCSSDEPPINMYFLYIIIIFTPVCQSFCAQGGLAWQWGMRVGVGGMHGGVHV